MVRRRRIPIAQLFFALGQTIDSRDSGIPSEYRITVGQLQRAKERLQRAEQRARQCKQEVTSHLLELAHRDLKLGLAALKSKRKERRHAQLKYRVYRILGS